MKNHGIVATDWQWEASSHERLNAIALPKNDLTFQISENIYFQEPWAHVGDPYGYVIKGQGIEYPEPEWQPAETMPPEAARWFREITQVRLIKMSELTAQDSFDLGWEILDRYGRDLPCASRMVSAIYVDVMRRYWEEYQGFPWNDDQFVIILSLGD